MSSIDDVSVSIQTRPQVCPFDATLVWRSRAPDAVVEAAVSPRCHH